MRELLIITNINDKRMKSGVNKTRQGHMKSMLIQLSLLITLNYLFLPITQKPKAKGTKALKSAVYKPPNDLAAVRCTIRRIRRTPIINTHARLSTGHSTVDRVHPPPSPLPPRNSHFQLKNLKSKESSAPIF